MSDISPTQQLRNLSLTLYAFDLRRDIDGIGQIKPNELLLWKQFEQVGRDSNIDALKDLKRQLISVQQNDQYSPRSLNLLASGEDSIDFSISREADAEMLEMKGNLSAFRVDDAYIADLTLFPRNLINLAQLGRLKLNEIFLSSRIQPSLGQTLFLYAEADALYKEDQQLSEAFVTQVFGTQFVPEYHYKGKLLGCSIFEYSIAIKDPNRQSHVLVLINHTQLPIEMDAVVEKILYVLLSRHKILYTYRQANVCNHQARAIYKKLEQNIVQPFDETAQAPDHLRRFQELLAIQLPQDAFQYAQYLRNLSDYVTTLDTNLTNYNQKLRSLNCYPETDLVFLQDFSDLAETKYKAQIQIYLDYLAPGQALFQQLIDTIRGLVDIEQAANDRRLGTTIQVLGVSLATGAIVASGYSYTHVPLRRPFSTSVIHPFANYLLWSGGIGALSGLMTYWAVKWSAKLLKSRSRSK